MTDEKNVEVTPKGSISTFQPKVLGTLRKSSVPSAEAPVFEAFQRVYVVSLGSAATTVLQA